MLNSDWRKLWNFEISSEQDKLSPIVFTAISTPNQSWPVICACHRKRRNTKEPLARNKSHWQNISRTKHYPGQKKNHSRDLQWEERCFIIWYHARWCTISAGQKSLTESRITLPCADRSLSSMITRSNSVLLTANLGDGSFFFVQDSMIKCMTSIHTHTRT